jgi:hypothetical protein
MNRTVDLGQVIVAVVTAIGFIASWVGFKSTVLVRMARMETDLRDAFGPDGRIQHIEDIQREQGGHIQRIVGRLESK